jgi:D-beta-D-heptose 7-phosphate kinase/D-beta-D-heptose 1-phosphate adenosyltransferase
MKNIENVRILVIGDVMLDRYIVGDVERISPEAPVPIVKVTDEYATLGGCGNVARNILSIGANVDCLASVGKDKAGREISDIFDNSFIGNFLIEQSNETTVKERIVANSRKIQMIRVDREHIKKIKADYAKKKLQEYFALYSPDIIVVSDYAKGMITWELMVYLREQRARIIVDPKPQNGQFYTGVYMITPNEKEWSSMMLSSAYNLKDVKYALITRGKNGMTLFDFKDNIDIPAEEVHNVFNVSGAGDTVVASMAVCLAMGIKPIESAKISNMCASAVVTEPGTSVVSAERFQSALWRYLKDGH